VSVTTDETRKLVKTSLAHIVPGDRVDALAADTDLRQAFELDSLDYVEFVERLSQAAGVRIDEEDYPELRTIATLTAFLARRR
jgi:acyl carrier protein